MSCRVLDAPILEESKSQDAAPVTPAATVTPHRAASYYEYQLVGVLVHMGT